MNSQEAERFPDDTCDYVEERSKPKRQKSSSRLTELSENQDGLLVSGDFSNFSPLACKKNLSSLIKKEGVSQDYRSSEEDLQPRKYMHFCFSLVHVVINTEKYIFLPKEQEMMLWCCLNWHLV